MKGLGQTELRASVDPTATNRSSTTPHVPTFLGMSAFPGLNERGGALVEMAVILPLFILMIFGMIEASWAFAQANDVRHGAREGARLAAVSAAPYESVDEIGAEVCNRMDIAGGYAVNVTFATPNGDGSRGSEGSISVSLAYTSLTGSLDQFFGGKTIGSSVDFLIESPLTGGGTWWEDVGNGTATHSC